MHYNAIKANSCHVLWTITTGMNLAHQQNEVSVINIACTPVERHFKIPNDLHF